MKLGNSTQLNISKLWNDVIEVQKWGSEKSEAA